MNNKRQTIWLVSMLSLMVILSAYYLFTDDSGPAAPPVADSTQANGLKLDGGAQAGGGEVVVNEVEQEGMDGDAGATEGNNPADEEVQSGGTKDEKGATQDEAKAGAPSTDKAGDKTEGAKQTSKTDEEVLKDVAAAQSSSAGAKLEAYQLDRANRNMKMYEDLMAKLDNQKTTPEETAQVTEQMKALEAREEIMYAIEEQLQQKYENAVVKEENNRYNVVVLSEKMDAKQAAGIVDLVMKELKVSQDKVTVQYIAP